MSLLYDAVQNQESFEFIQNLLKGDNFSIDFQDQAWGQTPLYLALAMDRENVALEIIRHGADVKLSTFDNQTTPFMLACRYSLDAAVREIIMRIPNLEVANQLDRTPVHFAAQFSSLETVKLLVSRGASVEFKDKKKVRSIFHAAVLGGNLDTAKYFLTEFKGLFSVHFCDVWGYQALHLAALRGHPDMAKWLISQGAMVDEHSNGGFSPLELASKKGKIDVVRCLVEAGAEINPGICRRPLFYSTLRVGHMSFVQSIRLLGNDLAQAAFHFDPFLFAWPPLACAAMEGHVLIVQELMFLGADPHRVYEGGLTARKHAMQGGHDRVVELLDAWRSIQALWVVCAAGQVARIGKRSELKRLPKDLYRMIGSILEPLV
jgi:ankyrin repeat protein